MAKIPNIYHSALVNMGPVLCKVVSDVLTSKWKNKDGTDKFYVNLVVGGEEHSYTVENDACGEALADRKGQTLLLTFSGSRDDAEISVGAAPASAAKRPVPTGPAKPSASARRAAPAQASPPPDDSDQVPGAEVPEKPAPPPRNPAPAHVDPVSAARMFLCRRANALGLAADAALYMITEFAARHDVAVDKQVVVEAMVQELARNTVPTLYIALENSWKEQHDLAAQQPVASLNAILGKHGTAKAGE